MAREFPAVRFIAGLRLCLTAGLLTPALVPPASPLRLPLWSEYALVPQHTSITGRGWTHGGPCLYEPTWAVSGR